MKMHWRRKNIFINKELQGKYIFNFFIFLIAGTVLFTLILGLLSANTMTMVYDNYKLQIGETPFMLMKEIIRAHWIFIIIGGLFIVVSSMILTHHFVGPLYHFEKSVNKMVRGNLDFTITLREHDAGGELAGKINQFNDKLSSNLHEMSQLIEKMDSDLSEASDLLHEEAKEASVLLNQAIDYCRRMKVIVESYRLKNLRE